MTTGRRQPLRLTAAVSYREAEPGTCEQPRYFGSDLWFIEGDTTTNANSEAARICAECPIRATCRTDAETQPHRYRGTIRGGLAYFKSGAGQPFLRCEAPDCTRTFARNLRRSRPAKTDYCSARCRNRTENTRPQIPSELRALHAQHTRLTRAGKHIPEYVLEGEREYHRVQQAAARDQDQPAPAPAPRSVFVTDEILDLRLKSKKLQRAGLPVPEAAKAAEREYERAKQAHHRTRRGGRPPVQPCGTVAAHRRHQRHGETPCQRCQDANTLARAERRGRPGAA